MTKHEMPHLRFWDHFNEVFFYSENYRSIAEFFKDFILAKEGENGPILMLGSGKKDKNGTEVFQADLIQGAFGKYVVKYFNGEWVCEIVDQCPETRSVMGFQKTLDNVLKTGQACLCGHEFNI